MKHRARKKIKGKKGISLIMVVIGMVIFSTFAMSATSLMLQLQQNTVLTSDRLEEMTIAYDAWNKIVGEDFEELTARIELLSERTETTTVGTKYQLTSTYGTEGVFLNGQCSSGTATDEQQRCIPVTISISNTTAPSEKPYALSTTRIASKGGSGGSWGPPDWNNSIHITSPTTINTATTNGYIYAYGCGAYNTETGVYINNKYWRFRTMWTTNAVTTAEVTIFPIKKGDTFYITGYAGQNNGYDLYFIPCSK